jgi:diguanylate cyclase (GGDEF)-like protein
LVLGPAFGSIARASDAVDLHLLARALDATHCRATTAVAVARLPATCFIAVNSVPESVSDTYFTPDMATYRFVVPAGIGAGGPWDIHLDFMVFRGTLTDVSPEGVVRATEPIGMEIPVADRPVHTYDDRVPLPPALRPGDTVVLDMETMRRQFDAFELRTAASLKADDDHNARVYYGPLAFLNGMLFSMALFNVLLFALLRRRSYLLYSLAMLAMIFFETVQSGIAWMIVWPQFSVRDAAPAYVAYVVYFALVTAFTRSFLELRRVAPRTDAVLLIAFGGLVLDCVLYVVFPGVLQVAHLWNVVDPVSVTFMIGALLAAGIVAVKNNVLSARYYVIGFGGAAIGLILGEAADYGLITLGVWHDLCSGIGVAWEAIFLAFALAERIRSAEREASRLSEFAYKDQLTGIANRRSFDENLEIEWRRGTRTERPLSLLMVDIDYFKLYNDKFGHQQGDWALRQVAVEIERAARRPGDFSARYGGEEFAIVLPETSLEGAFAAAQAVRLAIRDLAIAFDENPLTVSVGCATLVPSEGEDASALIRLADAALYQAKAAGRDRAMAAGAPPPNAQALGVES